MIPHYTIKNQSCEWCKEDILIGHEAIYADGYYCNKKCLADGLLEETLYDKVYLTNDKSHGSVN